MLLLDSPDLLLSEAQAVTERSRAPHHLEIAEPVTKTQTLESVEVTF